MKEEFRTYASIAVEERRFSAASSVARITRGFSPRGRTLP